MEKNSWVNSNEKMAEPLEFIALIVPDVHGRTFWKEAVSRYPDIPVVFLGDYLDPYRNRIEKISSQFALRNFQEILEYKCLHDDNVTLLLGNHDLHYFSYDADCSRKDLFLAEEIGQLFSKNLSMFRIATWMQTENNQVLFTHAGILSGWWNMRFPSIPPDSCQSICDTLNDEMTRRSFLVQLVMDYSWERGGVMEYGSPVWADVDEFMTNDAVSTLPKEIYQIFGHTQQIENPVFGERYCCLDCRRAFLLTKSGVVVEIDS